MRLLRSLLVAAPFFAFSSSTLADDGRAGHVSLGLRAGYQGPWGSAESGLSQSGLAAWGPTFGGELNYGISQYVLVGVFFDYATFGAPSGCSGCSAQSLAGGLAVQYHLIEGTPFDPFLGLGLGYRSTRFEQASTSVTYGGPFARIMVAGDWYPTPVFGFGPYLDFSLGRYVTRNPGSIGDGALHSFFTGGIRIVLDPFQ